MIQPVLRSTATLFSLAFFSLVTLADTTTVQTFTFEAQNNPATAYDSPGRRWFEFPASDNGVQYGKAVSYTHLTLPTNREV